MKYENITAIDKTKGTLFTHLMADNQEEYQVSAVKEITKSGLVNNLFGHSQRTIDQTAKVEHRAVAAKVETSNLMVNSEINSTVNPRTLFTPVDCGNTHENYHKAIHQNTRIKSLYSFSLHAAVSVITTLDLLDVIQYAAQAGHNASDTVVKPSLAGAYLIVGKTTYITGGGFVYEKYELSRPGLNDDPGKSRTQLGT
jgi:hypothetical protein